MTAAAATTDDGFMEMAKLFAADVDHFEKCVVCDQLCVIPIATTNMCINSLRLSDFFGCKCTRYCCFPCHSKALYVRISHQSQRREPIMIAYSCPGCHTEIGIDVVARKIERRRTKRPLESVITKRPLERMKRLSTSPSRIHERLYVLADKQP